MNLLILSVQTAQPLQQLDVRDAHGHSGGADVEDVELFQSLLLVHVFVPQYLVKNPVEYVEEEEGQREAGPRHGVYLFGSIDEQLPHLLRAFAPAASRRYWWILGSVCCGSRSTENSNSIVGADLGVLADAGS